MDIGEKLVREIEAGGTAIWLKDNGKIGLRKGNIACAVERIEPHRAEVLGFLLSRRSAPTPMEPTDSEVELEELPELAPLAEAVAVCPTCGAAKVPSIAIQITNLRTEQLGKSPYWQFSEADFSRLEKRMRPGDQILYPIFARSIRVKQPDGFIYIFERSK